MNAPLSKALSIAIHKRAVGLIARIEHGGEAMARSDGNLDWVYLDTARGACPSVGDMVSAEAGGLPIYRVISLGEGRVWLKDIDSGQDRVCPLSDFHWMAAGGL